MATFTNLPAEIRNLVYNEVLTTILDPCSSSPGLMETSRLLHQEAASYYYQHNHFVVNLPALSSKCATMLPSIADRYLRCLRRLTVRAMIGQPDSISTGRVIHCINTLATIGTTFEVLNFEFSSQGSNILQSCVDDCLLYSGHPIVHAFHTLLAFNTAKRVHVRLNHVWFATGVISELQQASGNRLKVSTTLPCGTVERQPTGHSSLTHLSTLGFDEQDTQDANDLWSKLLHSTTNKSAPSSLRSALSELDMFSPEDFQTSETEDAFCSSSPGSAPRRLASHDTALDGDMDIYDSEMEDVADTDAMLEITSAMQMQRANANDVCYMTNFAPSLLGRWAA